MKANSLENLCEWSIIMNWLISCGKEDREFPGEKTQSNYICVYMHMGALVCIYMWTQMEGNFSSIVSLNNTIVVM